MSIPIAIITGAGRGIGRATAVALSGAGYRCVLVSRSVAELDETAALCSDVGGDVGGGGAMVLPVDVLEVESIAVAAARVVDEFGRIDVLVNNAGAGKLLPFAETDRQTFNDTIAINLAGPWHFSQAVWPVMAGGGGGVIVNVSSVAARDPFNGFSAYGAAKAGVNLLTLALAREGKPLGIRVHAVAPGGVETALLRSIASVDRLPADQVLKPQDVADVILQCARGDLRYASGETIYVQR